MSDTPPRGDSSSTPPTPTSRSPRKTNIGRVLDGALHIASFVRVRPFTERQILQAQLAKSTHVDGDSEQDRASQSQPLRSCLYSTSSTEVVVDQRFALSNDRSITRDVSFSFDGVLWSLSEEQRMYCHPSDLDFLSRPLASQRYVFDVVGLPVVSAAINGVNACVLAFGQTGSGKSYTIFGTPSNPGLCPNIAQEVFHELEYMKQRKNPADQNQYCRQDSIEEFSTMHSSHSSLYQYSVSIGCFEIYNEKIFDLLAKTFTTGRSATRGSAPPSPCIPQPNPADLSFDDDGISTPMIADDSQCVSRQSPARTPEQPPSAPTLIAPPPLNLYQEENDHLHLERNANTAGSGGGIRFYPIVVKAPQSLSDNGDSHHHHHEEFNSGGAGLSGSNTLSTTIPSSSTPTLPPSSVSSGSGSLRIRHDPLVGTYVEGLRKEFVEDAHALSSLVQQAMKYRVTSANHVHDLSSRSHAIITITISQDDKVTGTRKISSLHLVDLAGSERGARHGATGQSLVESKKINLSLTTLRRVIDLMIVVDPSKVSVAASRKPSGPPLTPNAVSTPQTSGQHLPVRDSKLTEVLAECFGGNSFTSMIATVSPHEANILETLDSLRYCTKAKGIVNRVRPNEERIAVAIHAIQTEIDRLRHEMCLREMDNSAVSLRSLIGLRSKVSFALSRSIEDRGHQVDEIAKELSSLNVTLASFQRVIAAKAPLLADINNDLEETKRINEATSEAQKMLYEVKHQNALLMDQQLKATEEIERLESSPFAESVAQFLRVRKMSWRLAFLINAKELRHLHEKEDLLDDIRRLRRECARAQDHGDIVHEQQACGQDREWLLYRQHNARLRETAVALGNAFEDFYRSSSCIRKELQVVERRVCDGRVELELEGRAADEMMQRVAEHARFSAGMICTMEDEVDRLRKAAQSAGEEYDAITSLNESIIERIESKQDYVAKQTALVKEQAKPDVASQLLALSAEVHMLDCEVNDDESALANLIAEHEAMEAALRKSDAEVEDFSKHLGEVEHTARRLCLPDAKPKYADAPIAHAVLAVERSNSALGTPSRRIAGSYERMMPSQSPHSTRRDPSATPRLLHRALHPNATPLTWKQTATPSNPNRIRHVDASPMIEPWRNMEGDVIVLRTEDF